ncbi:MAG: zinc ribbon domain-containing protein [Deltaproteobacteria bacterium]|nr:zinc ribbon domain-containing protein [Deltaproteobacteria bacterium]
MPLYDFRCASCGLTFDAMKPMAERLQPEPCPHCEGTAQLQLSAAAVLSGGPPCDGNIGACPSSTPFAAPPCAGGRGKCPS